MIYKSIILLSLFCFFQLHAGSCSNGFYINKIDLKDYGRLSRYVKSNRITDLYIKVRGKKLKGSAKKLVTLLNKDLPEVKKHAWIGRRICGEKKTKCFDFDSVEKKKKLISFILKLSKSGFNGVNINFEPIENGDRRLLGFFKNLKKFKPKGFIVSYASPLLALEGDAKKRFVPTPQADTKVYFWDKNYFSLVLRYVDQLMVMNYDTALMSGKIYTEFTSWQLKSFIELVKKRRTALRYGIPSYDFGRPGLFNNKVENINTALSGVLKGLDNIPDDFGLVIYSFSTTDDSEWKSFNERWVKGPYCIY